MNLVQINLCFQNGMVYKIKLEKDKPILKQLYNYISSNYITIPLNHRFIYKCKFITETDTVINLSLTKGKCIDILEIY